MTQERETGTLRTGRVLILTLASGERELASCRESVEAQNHQHREHRIFEDLPNKEAHDHLYRTIMENRDRFDLFLKLDADMAFADPEVLSDLVGVFEQRPGLDHLVVAVSDWMTDSRIIGFHVFSNRVRWREHAEMLYVDPDPLFPGSKMVIEDPPRDLVFHAANPSEFQAFHFGAHRALRASQSGRRLRDTRAHSAHLQWVYLSRVWKHFERDGDRRLGLAMLGADYVFRRQLPATANEFGDATLRAKFDDIRELTAERILGDLLPRWGTPTRRLRTWVLTLGPFRAALVVLRRLRDTVAEAVKVLLGRRPDHLDFLGGRE
jgi:hypothetical protein